MARPRGVEPLTFWSVVKRSIQLSYGRCLCYSWWCWLDIHYGAAERTRTSTGLLLPAPQAGASTIPPRPHTAYSWHITMKLMERVKRIELSQSAWKAEVLPLNYTRILGRLMGIEPTNVGATIRCVNHFATIAMAGVAGIEPTLTVLETAVLPLNYTPIYLVPEAGLEPATYWLQVSCSTNWAIPAYIMVTRTGFEPVYACVKGMCVKPLHQRAIK